jgi:hypothetical protein
MAAGITISLNVLGDAELAAQFDALAGRVQKKVLRDALRPAAKVIQQAVQGLIQSRTGTAAESLKVRAGKRSRRYPDRVTVNVITAGGWFRGLAFYFPFADLGHKAGSRKLGNRKKVPGRRWMARAVQSAGPEAMDLARRLIAEGIQREANGAR